MWADAGFGPAAAQVFCVWLTPNQDLAYVLATGYVASSILLSGFYLRVTDMALSLMRSLSYLSYTKCAAPRPRAAWGARAGLRPLCPRSQAEARLIPIQC